MYDDPAELDTKLWTGSASNIDPTLRDLIKDIIMSGWLLPEESCSGHPVNEPSGWGGKYLYLRLVIKDENIKWLLWLVDHIRDSCGYTLGWHTSLSYDRSDELGSHWFLEVKYAEDINMRAVVVEIIRQHLSDMAVFTS